MASQPAYDRIAEWYEHEFLPAQHNDPIGVTRVLRQLLGAGAGECIEIGCGTGAHADTLRDLGWTPLGIDISRRMLRYAKGRLTAVCGNAERLPIRSVSVSAAVAVMVHTDMPGYAAALREAARVLRPGGVFVHVGVHPCFCGGFADRTDPDAVVIRPGYADGHWTKQSWSDRGVRDKVGATHYPLPQLLTMIMAAGLRLDGFAEGVGAVPTVFGVRALKAE